MTADQAPVHLLRSTSLSRRRLLHIGATRDMQDPYQWALDMADQLESATLLTREGDGHPSYFESACVEAAVNAYLLDLTVPASGVTCPSTGGLRARFS